MLQTLAILCTEEKYAHGLMEYMNQFPDFIFRAMVFTKPGFYLEYEKRKSVDVLLFDSSVTEDFLLQVHPAAAYCLSDDKEETKRFDKKCIFMYQSARRIITLICDFYKKDQTVSGNTLRRKETCMIGIFGMNCSNEQQKEAISMTKQKGAGKKVLYIEWNPFIQPLQMTEERYRLTDFIYTLKKEEEIDTLAILDCIGHREEFDYIIGVEHFNDLYELSGESIQKAMTFLKKECDYEYIILDLPVLCPVFSELLRYCDLIYQFMDSSEDIITEFRRQLMLSNGEETVNQIQQLK